MRKLGVDADSFAVFAHSLVADKPGYPRKESVISPDSDVHSRVDPGASLPNQNASGIDEFSAVAFHAQTLRIAVSAVLRTTEAFLMCHR